MIGCQEKCRGGIAVTSFSTVGPIWLCCWLENKTKTKNMCSHVIFDIYFKFYMKNADGEDFTKFL